MTRNVVTALESKINQNYFISRSIAFVWIYQD